MDPRKSRDESALRAQEEVGRGPARDGWRPAVPGFRSCGGLGDSASSARPEGPALGLVEGGGAGTREGANGETLGDPVFQRSWMLRSHG